MAGTLAELKTKQFFRANFAPTTGIGRFDAECSPARGVITIETCLYLNMLDTTDEKSFATQFAQLVPQTWNDKFMFKCTKPGFDIDIKPKFRLRFESDFNESHYVVNVSESIFGKEKVSRQDYFQAKGAYKPKVAQLGGMKALAPVDFTAPILEELASLFPVHVKVPLVGGNLSPHATDTLRLVGRHLSKLNPKPTLYLKSGGSKASVNMQMVAGVLQAGGAGQIVQRKRNFKYKNEVVVTLKDDLDDAAAGAAATQFSYSSTVVHEYGHMLGLTDEYNCLSRTASDKLAELRFIDASEQYVFENLHAPGAHVMENEFADSQREQVALCHRAGVAAPQYGFKSDSIMASGRDVHPGHMVTIWECLVDMMSEYTAAADWKIVPSV